MNSFSRLPFPQGLRGSAALLIGSLLASTLMAAPSTPGSPPTDTPSSTTPTPSRAASSNAEQKAPQLSRAQERFILRAVAAGEEELALSQLASARATSPQVRNYAQQLVRDHQALGREITALKTAKGAGLHQEQSGTVSVLGVEPATGLALNPESVAGPGTGMAESTGTVERAKNKLIEKTGADFDKTYVKMIIDAHEDAVELYKDAADDDGADAEVQAFANEHLPALRQHLDQAKHLKDTLD